MEKRTLRKKRIKKEKRKNLTLRALSLIIALSIITISLPHVLNTYAESVDGNSVNKDIIINKTAEKTGKPDEFKITLSVEHKPVIPPIKKADVVLILDESTSMYDKIDSVKEGAKKFCNRLLESSNNQVRISLVKFSSIPDLPYTREREEEKSTLDTASESISDFTNDQGKLNVEIDKLNSEQKGTKSTHTAAGINRAGIQIDKSIKDNKDAKRYVVMFTDGIPNLPRRNPDGAALDEYNKVISMDKGLKFYSLGLFTIREGLYPDQKAQAENERNDAKKLLSKLQNAVPKEEYVSKYYRQDTKQICGVFQDISNDIEGDISNLDMKDTVIKDVVSDEFEIIPNSYSSSGNVNPNSLKNTVVNGQGITFNLGTIESNGSVSFLVKSKDPYFGGKGIFTNKNATITCIDSNNGNNINEEFNKPQVDIEYKKASITIEKEVIDDKGNVVPNIEDKFSVSIIGTDENQQNSKYNFQLAPNNAKDSNVNNSMEVFLKGKNTNISNNPDTSLNYFTIGNFNVKEIIPMNYKFLKNQIWDNNKNSWVDLNGTFTIDKDNNNIKIKVINKLVNTKYWFNKATKENNFQYIN